MLSLTRSLGKRSQSPTHSLANGSPTATESDHDESIRSHGREQEECSFAVSDYSLSFTIMGTCLVPFVVMLIQLDPKKFFDHYTVQFWVFVAAISIFCTAVLIEKKRLFRRYFVPKVLDVVAFLSVILSKVSLISMLVAINYSYIPYVFWVALLCLMLTWRLLCAVYHRLHAIMKMMVSGVRHVVLGRMGLLEEAPSSPV